MEQLPFIPNFIYNRRRDIHEHFGGNWQSGISTSSTYPYIFIFSGATGHQHGYRDEWNNENIFSYTGEGQSGDMKFTKGNLALRDHLNTGKRVFLFSTTTKKGFVKFEAELEYFSADYFETHDTSGQTRIGIKFFFKRKGATIPLSPIFFDNDYQLEEDQVRYEVKKPSVTERKGLVTSRVGQGAYRQSIIHRWEYQCAVTKFNKIELLIASHIQPWSESSNEERLDVHNGILLSPNFDALFDRSFISFENSGEIILSNKIESGAFHKLGVTGKECIKKLTSENKHYLDYHRSHLK